jgi:hypothetical protein
MVFCLTDVLRRSQEQWGTSKNSSHRSRTIKLPSNDWALFPFQGGEAICSITRQRDPLLKLVRCPESGEPLASQSTI